LFSDIVGAVGSGAKAFKAVAEIFGGMGDYEIGPEPSSLNANSLVAPLAPNNIPFMHSSAQGIRVTHREYLMDVAIGTQASPWIQQLVLNPGDARVFPWLSEMSRNFTQWMPLGMAFEMKSTVLHGVNNINPQYGTFTMATNYDVYAPVFNSDRVRMLNHFFASSGGPLDNQLHCIECAPEQTTIKPLFIRQDNAIQEESVALTFTGLSATAGATYDARLYDLGRLEMLGINAPSTLAAPYTVGELWIAYDILLLKPQISSHAGYTYQSYYNVPPITQDLTVRPEINLYLENIFATPELDEDVKVEE
jgi:hypothetical protein